MTTQDTITALVNEGETLHGKLGLVQTETSKENVEAYQLEIDRFLNKVMAVQHSLSREIDERRAMKNTLKLMEDMLKTDKASAKSTMFRLIEERKEATYGRSNLPQ